MSSPTPTREDALALLKKYNQSESLIKHAFAVEGVMRYMARKYNGGRRRLGGRGPDPRPGLRTVPRPALQKNRSDPEGKQLARRSDPRRGQPRLGHLQ
jgi:hypothetical protein